MRLSRVFCTCSLLLSSLAGLSALLLSLATLPERPSGKRAVAGNAVLSDLGADDSEPWSVLILADVQNGFHYLPDIFQRDMPRNLRAIVCLGDLSANHDEVHMQLPVRELLATPPPAPFFVVPGNHDIRGEEGRDCFVRWFGATTFEFRIGSTCFLGVDNADGPLEERALARLEERLAAASGRGQRVVLCMHRDIIDWEEKETVPGTEARNSKLLELVKRHDVCFVLAGHHHQPHDETRDGTRFVIAPASGHRDHERGQNPISFLILRWNGASFALERQLFCRRNTTELAGRFLYLSQVFVQPLLNRYPIFFWVFVLLAAGSIPATWMLFGGAGGSSPREN